MKGNKIKQGETEFVTTLINCVWASAYYIITLLLKKSIKEVIQNLYHKKNL
jgi:hypothetical protein